MRLVLVLLVVVLGLFAAFAIQNPEIMGFITVRFFTLSGTTSVLAVIVAAFGAGVLVGFLPGIPASFRRKRRIRERAADLAGPREAALWSGSRTRVSLRSCS